MNKGALNKERATLVFMVANHRVPNFGKLAYDQIWSCSNVVANESSNLRMVLPNLIDQLLRFQRIVPQISGDTESPRPEPFRHVLLAPPPSPSVTAEIPGLSANSSLASDLAHVVKCLQAIQHRLAGKYSEPSCVALSCFQ